MSIQPLLKIASHPVTLLFLENATSTLILMLTSSTSIIRPGFLVLIFISIWLSMPTYLERVGRVPWAAFLAGNSVLGALQYIELLLLRKWTFDDQRRKLLNGLQEQNQLKVDRPASIWERLYFGYFVTTSSRHVATPYEIKSLPPYSKKNPARAPSRVKFVVDRAVISVLSYLFLDIVAIGARYQLKQNPLQASSKHVPFFARFGDLSYKELVMRTQDTFGYYVFCYFLIQCYTSIVAFPMVALGLDQPEYWRPNFGSLEEAYCLRQFWGVFWHQHLRSKLSILSDFATFRVCRLRKGSLSARYFNLFVAFFISGIVHCLTIYAAGFSFRQSCGSFKYFCSQVLGIMIEDGTQFLYRSLKGVPKTSQGKPPVWTRICGFIWVIFFLTWSTPAFFYPMQAANKGEKKDEILPFSPLSALQAMRSPAAL